MSDLKKQLFKLIDGKDVFLATHWDADGITSGSMIYHLIKSRAKRVRTISKGEVFLIKNEDIPKDCDIVIVTDIHPGKDIDKPIIYVDHHPCGSDPMAVDNGQPDDNKNIVLCSYDTSKQSCSLVVWEAFFKDCHDPYITFLAIIGFFGDGGKNTDIPLELKKMGVESFPELVELKPNPWRPGKFMMDIENFVSAFNTGKRMHWNGQVPLELFKNIDTIEPFIYNHHPLAQELQNYRKVLSGLYKKKFQVNDFGHCHVVKLDSPHNIQGVICMRYMDSKPIIVLNKRNGNMIGSMRVPDDLNFDCGAYLNTFTKKIPNAVGGGHEKAGGITFSIEHYDEFIRILKEVPKFTPNAHVQINSSLMNSSL